jgi:uncharacterized protein
MECLVPDLIGTLHRLYKTLISPVIGKRCRFYPSCSDYCLSCVRRFGYLRGGVLTATRLARCQPFGTPGFDPVPERFVWMSKIQPVPDSPELQRASEPESEPKPGRTQNDAGPGIKPDAGPNATPDS